MASGAQVRHSRVAASRSLSSASSGTCSVCHISRGLTKEGNIWSHGPRGQPCGGSGLPPRGLTAAAPQSFSLGAPVAPSSLHQGTQRTPPSPPSPTPIPLPLLPDLHEVMQRNISVLKHVPKAVRNEWASCLTGIFKDIASNPGGTQSWILLFMLPKCILSAPPFETPRQKALER